MKDTLKPGLSHTLCFTVPESKTVPHLYPEAPGFAAMPKVFATGFMVGLFEWACIELLKPHLDEGEGSLGIHVDFGHTAATPPGLTVTVTATCTRIDGRTAEFEVRGHDGIDEIGGGRHRRAIVRWEKFNARVAAKRAQAG
ncbi:MAG: thioesterase family protein [Rhodospirillales bacterium]|nr:thioesterase family protein [Rhodospirillales bacterium]